MRSFVSLATVIGSQPPELGVTLSRVDVGHGREDLFADRTPELLRSLAAQTRFESIRASTAIEGIEVDPGRADRIAADTDIRVRNRSEQEFAGYRDAIDELMRTGAGETLTIPYVLHLHRTLYGHSGGRGGSLKREDNLIARRAPDGRPEVLFTPPPWQETEFLLTELLDRYETARDARAAHPIVLIAVFILDFLAIHPVLDGNGRLARLLTTQQLLRSGYAIPRYVSVEQRIFETRNSYYAALRASQRGWHDSAHDPWPWVGYLAGTLADCYDVLEGRVEAAAATAGLSKQERVRRHVLEHGPPTFRLRDVRAALPGVSDPTITLALRALRDDGLIAVRGTGRGAVWQRVDGTA